MRFFVPLQIEKAKDALWTALGDDVGKMTCRKDSYIQSAAVANVKDIITALKTDAEKDIKYWAGNLDRMPK